MRQLIPQLLRLSRTCALLALTCAAATVHGEASGRIAMTQSNSGTLTLTASAAGVEAEFMLDTGAGLVTLNENTFDRIRRQSSVRRVRQVGARLGNNRIQLLNVYEIASFKVGPCELGPLEVAVMKGGGRNLLGLSALAASESFSIQLSPPALSLSHCHGGEGIASL